MWLVTVAMLFAGGALAAASLIIAKKPDAKEYIDKLTPYQGWIGITLFVWGLIDLIRFLPHIGSFFKIALFWAIIFLVTIFVEITLGFLLGFGLITKYALSKNETAMQKGQEIRAKLAGIQGPLGLLAIALSVLFLVLTVLR